MSNRASVSMFPSVLLLRWTNKRKIIKRKQIKSWLFLDHYVRINPFKLNYKRTQAITAFLFEIINKVNSGRYVFYSAKVIASSTSLCGSSSMTGRWSQVNWMCCHPFGRNDAIRRFNIHFIYILSTVCMRNFVCTIQFGDFGCNPTQVAHCGSYVLTRKHKMIKFAWAR